MWFHCVLTDAPPNRRPAQSRRGQRKPTPSSRNPGGRARGRSALMQPRRRKTNPGRPGVFSSGETRSSSGALSSPDGPGWPPGPLSHSSRRIFDHARDLFDTGLGRPHPCLPPRSRIGPRRRRQQRGDDISDVLFSAAAGHRPAEPHATRKHEPVRLARESP